ncbi:hypothetical protein [Paraburkholderia ultramafica]|uniref:hypothetical protein n=1 Tax=Paraburkholderia ultramafica TaxID=1544867 RepID=UPI001581B16E|nr:hypothetical protein [Paraburkholderia ultramafica]
MEIQRSPATAPLTALVTLASNAQQNPPDVAAARTNAEQQQQVQQQRAAMVPASGVRAVSPEK